jgi:hypothetical protein
MQIGIKKKKILIKESKYTEQNICCCRFFSQYPRFLDGYLRNFAMVISQFFLVNNPYICQKLHISKDSTIVTCNIFLLKIKWESFVESWKLICKVCEAPLQKVVCGTVAVYNYRSRVKQEWLKQKDTIKIRKFNLFGFVSKRNSHSVPSCNTCESMLRNIYHYPI